MATAAPKSILFDPVRFPALSSKASPFASPLLGGRSGSAAFGGVVEEDSGECEYNDGWITLDTKNIEFTAVVGKGQSIITDTRGMSQTVRNDKLKYGVVLGSGGYKGREARQDMLTPAKEAMFPLPYGTLVEHICMAPYEAGESQGVIRTEHVTRWWMPGSRWPSWIKPSGSPEWLKTLSQESAQ